MTTDEQHLDLLAVFHYIVGGLTGLLACFPLIHVGVGLLFLRGGFEGPNPPPAVIGWVFVIVGGFFVLCGWLLAAAILVAGRNLKRRRARTYCLVVGALECMLMPFGTILGVFTLIVLTKEPVQALFEARPGTA